MRSLSLLLVALFAVICFNGGIDPFIWLYADAGLSLSGLSNGRIWQLVTYGLLHGNWPHVVLNTLMLYCLGDRLQFLIGWKKALGVTLAGVVLGGAFHLALCWILDPAERSYLVGVSGGVMAVLLCLTTMHPYRILWPLQLQARHLGHGFMLSSLGLVLMIPSLGIPGLSSCGETFISVFGAGVFQASHACHLGGGLAGIMSAKFIEKNS